MIVLLQHKLTCLTCVLGSDSDGSDNSSGSSNDSDDSDSSGYSVEDPLSDTDEPPGYCYMPFTLVFMSSYMLSVVLQHPPLPLAYIQLQPVEKLPVSVEFPKQVSCQKPLVRTLPRGSLL